MKIRSLTGQIAARIILRPDLREAIISGLVAAGNYRGMAQSGSASALGAEGRGFKSLCPDQLCVQLSTQILVSREARLSLQVDRRPSGLSQEGVDTPRQLRARSSTG